MRICAINRELPVSQKKGRQRRAIERRELRMWATTPLSLPVHLLPKGGEISVPLTDAHVMLKEDMAARLGQRCDEGGGRGFEVADDMQVKIGEALRVKFDRRGALDGPGTCLDRGGVGEFRTAGIFVVFGARGVRKLVS